MTKTATRDPCLRRRPRRRSRSCANLLFDYPRDFAVRLWDGTVWEPDDGRVPGSPSSSVIPER